VVAQARKARTGERPFDTCLRLADELPTMLCAGLGGRVEVIDIDRDVERSDVAWSGTYVRAFGGLRYCRSSM
jgi:hypothetical protein